VKLSRAAYGRLAALHRRYGAPAEAAPAPAGARPEAEAEVLASQFSPFIFLSSSPLGPPKHAPGLPC